jgi:UDP-glucuronate 4-epimerase
MTVLVTGAAGFIGNHLALRLLEDGHEVVGVDNLSAYYDVGLKRSRLERLRPYPSFHEHVLDICDAAALDAVFDRHAPDRVAHMAAQPGVRYSLEHPQTYVQSNIVGFANLLEAMRRHRPAHLVYASSSSVYGANRGLPSNEGAVTDHPLTIYAASKKANEVMAHSYSHLFALPVTGVRFFTVYGEWGRPDMAFFKFTDAILAGETIRVHNEGRMSRDFTYVADVVEALVRIIELAPAADPSWDAERPGTATSGVAPYRLLNIGNGKPVALMRYLEVLQEALGREAKLEMVAMQPGEAKDTWADTAELHRLTGFVPGTPVETGISNFVAWYRAHYGV